MVDETGRVTESSSDGWSISTSPDGKTVVITGPNGEVETAVAGEDGSVVKTFEDGSVGRFFPETGQVTYTSASGDTVNMRVDKNGNLIAADDFGSIYEYNPKTNTTNVIDAQGNAQTSERNVDGTYEVTLQDGTVIAFDAAGNPLVNTNEVIETEEELQISIQTECENCVTQATWNKENATFELDFGDNNTTTTQLSVDGIVTVETSEGIRSYDPSTGVTGSSTVVKDGDLISVTGSNGGQTSISEDGNTTEVIDANGQQATARAGDTGMTVVVNGVEYVYAY